MTNDPILDIFVQSTKIENKGMMRTDKHQITSEEICTLSHHDKGDELGKEDREQRQLVLTQERVKTSPSPY